MKIPQTFEIKQKHWREVMPTNSSERLDQLNPARRLCGEGNDFAMYFGSWEDPNEFCAARVETFRAPFSASRHRLRLPHNGRFLAGLLRVVRAPKKHVRIQTKN